MSKTTTFNDNIAKKYGITEAIILNKMVFYIEKNIVNRKKFIDGNYWIYNSNRAWQELFIYLSEKNIRTAIDNLIKKGAIKTGNHNKIKYDRTLWYSIIDFDIFREYGIDIEKAINEGVEDEEYSNNNDNSKLTTASAEIGKSNCQNRQIKLLESANRNVEIGEPIPVNIHYTSINHPVFTSREREKNNLDLDKNNNLGYSKQDAYFEFEKSIVLSYAKLTGKPISELRQINDFRTFEKRAMLEQAFNNRKIENWQEAIDLSLESVANADYKFKWFNFMNAVYYNLASATEKPKSSGVSTFEKMKRKYGGDWQKIHAAMSEKFGENWHEIKFGKLGGDQAKIDLFEKIDSYLLGIMIAEQEAKKERTTDDDWGKEKFKAEYDKEHEPVDFLSFFAPLLDDREEWGRLHRMPLIKA